MSNEDFIKLPNGKKIFLKDSYGKVRIDEMPGSRKLWNIFTSFDSENVLLNQLNSREISSIFSSLKDFAALDGNNELSSAELESFIKQNCPEEEFGEIKSNDMLKFLEVLQKKSDKSLKKAPPAKIHVENSFEKLFPELSFLDLGRDDNIDAQKLGFDEIKKHFSGEKYEIVKNIPSPDDAGMPMEGEISGIVNKETGIEVLSFQNKDEKENYIKFFDEKTGKKFSINVIDNIVSISNDYEFNNSNYRQMTVQKGKVTDLQYGKDFYIFDEGVLGKIYKPDSILTFENGFLLKEKPIIGHKSESKSEHVDISEKLAAGLDTENGTPDGFAKLIENSVKNNTIGSDMDDYFARTGRELTEDIENSKIPDKLKKELLNSICEPYIDSKYYDAHKKVDSSRVSNEYYRSDDEYSIAYNGPIVNVFNKTTGKNTRINLKSLIKIDYHSKAAKKRSLKTIQKLPGEVLENMAVEIRQIRGMQKEEQRSDENNMKIGGFYIADTITVPKLRSKTLIHEISHGIDEIYEGENPVMSSCKGKFKETFDKCM